jgi:hypothetical protein
LGKLADIDGPLVDPGSKGVTLTYSGSLRYDMTDLHQITATFADGVQWEYFFDTRSGLLRRLIRPSFNMLDGQFSRGPDVHDTYFDFRSVGSVLYPHLWVQSTEDSTHLFVVEDIQIGAQQARQTSLPRRCIKLAGGAGLHDFDHRCLPQIEAWQEQQGRIGDGEHFCGVRLRASAHGDGGRGYGENVDLGER